MKHIGWLPVIAQVYFIFCIDGAKTPSADESGARGTVHVYEGDDALLTCVIRGAADNTVMWKMEDRDRHSKRVLTAGDTRVTGDRRFHILHDEGGDVWVLAIKKVKASDTGVYICEVNSDPIVRSFHKLSVLSRELQPPKEGNTTVHYGSDNVLEIEERTDNTELLNHNYTDCCNSLNVSTKCLGFCVIQNILEGNTGQDPEQCEADFPAIVRCMADGRNHVPCCVQEGVPDICQDVCRGEYTMITDNIKTHFSCSAYTEQTLACIVEGIELLPSTPEGVQVDVVSDTMLNVTWDKPARNSASISEYAVNVSMLRSFDNNPPFSKNIEDQNSSWIIVTPHSVQVKVEETVQNVQIRNLTPYTMYEITVTASNSHGSSLASYAVRSVTLPAGKMKTTGNSKPPPLPDIKSCCVKKGITHNTCLNKLCDPAQSDATEVTDLMICAPWASHTYSCLTNGIDHTPCCKARGIPALCQELCSGNLTQIDYSYFKCLRYMGDYTNCLMRGYGVVPTAPTHVKVTNIDINFAIVHWDPPKTLNETITHYNVYYREVDDIYNVARKVNSPYVLEKLHQDSIYEVYVEAGNSHGPGEPSQRIVFRTLSVDLVNKEVEQPNIIYNVTECCVSSGLSDVCLPLCSYDASMSQLKSLAGICGNEFHKLIRCGAGGRNHNSCCERRGVPLNCLPICTGVIGKTVTASPPNTCIPFIGNIVQCFQEGTGQLPGPVSELHAVKLKNNSVTLEWSSPKDGSDVQDYVVHYQQVTNATMHEISLTLEQQVTVKGTTTKLENLETGKLYSIFVVSRNVHGTSLPSSILLLNVTEKDTSKGGITGVTSPPHSLAVSSHSANFVTITWQPPEFSHPAERLYYKLYWRGNADTTFRMVDTEITSHMIEGLSPNSQYIVYVVAVSKAGSSLASETLIAWTDPAFPAFVEAPTVHPLNMVVEGNSMTILCIAMGTPMPTISLYISGRLVRQETTRHMVTVIGNVTRDMNHISCYADNGYGTPMQATRHILINYIPKLIPSGITMATLGDNVALECAVDAQPEPKMMFWRDPNGRVPVIQGGKYSVDITYSKEEVTKYIMTLTINKIAVADEGDYYCHAENAFGTATQPVSVRVRNTPATHNVTQCCIQQNVSSACMNACSFYLDIDTAIEKQECANDLNKLMKCAADGSDHRGCCASLHVPRSCLDWCRGEPVVDNTMCIIMYTKPIMSCFREGRSKLPGPPQNVRVEVVDTHSVMVKWDPPIKNPHTVEVYRVFWRPIGNPRNPAKNDTKENNLLITGLKDDSTYELVIKASNQIGTSMLTDPLKFSTTEKYITSAASLGEDEHAAVGTALSVIMSLLIVSAMIGAGVYYLHSKQLLLRKSTVNGVAFENPSYLREVNMENIQQTGENTYMSNGLANGVQNQTAPQGWKQEPLHVPMPTEVPPSLYEELRLGSNGAGFMRLKP
ncbi:Ig-like and fibronectin type-III domain-containing protein 1 isoform X2 [Planococcus citri]|uniref:Ig-like and fibronectin type-III domain-containing protein 1 isoform X2 n=1 Tax=Planococcus citri TaxID=170843 RepID=UPI0031F9D1E5